MKITLIRKTKRSLILMFSLWILIVFVGKGVISAEQLQNKSQHQGLPLFFWKEGNFYNFGDHLSLKLVERIVGTPLKFYNKKNIHQSQKLLAIGSILFFANEADVVWGSGINEKKPYNEKDYQFKHLDVRSVRGPLTKAFLKDHFDIDAPEIYGDPGLLVPYLFPEFKKSENPSQEYVVILHYSDIPVLKERRDSHFVDATQPWDEVIEKIIDSRFVISSSLHGLVIAEAYGIPARMLRISEDELLLKFKDYYLGTGRDSFQYARSIQEALELGGEPPINCDVEKIYQAFPFDYWPNNTFYQPDFTVRP